MLTVPGADDVQLYQPRHQDGVRAVTELRDLEGVSARSR